MLSHDIVARRDYLPKLQDIPVEVDEDEGTIKMVQLVKSQEPLVCFTIRTLCANGEPKTTCPIQQGDSKTTEPIVVSEPVCEVVGRASQQKWSEGFSYSIEVQVSASDCLVFRGPRSRQRRAAGGFSSPESCTVEPQTGDCKNECQRGRETTKKSL